MAEPHGGSTVHHSGNILRIHFLFIINMEKKEKKGFWASLFSPKPCKCSCGDAYVIPNEETDKEPSGTAIDSGVGIKEIKVYVKGDSSGCEVFKFFGIPFKPVALFVSDVFCHNAFFLIFHLRHNHVINTADEQFLA